MVVSLRLAIMAPLWLVIMVPLRPVIVVPLRLVMVAPLRLVMVAQLRLVIMALLRLTMVARLRLVIKVVFVCCGGITLTIATREEIAYVGENGIEPNVKYKLDNQHRFIKE
jgi:hypothetical protein